MDAAFSACRGLPALPTCTRSRHSTDRQDFEALADKFDFSRFRSLCDVGGATGLLCIEVAKKHPHIECITLDLSPVEPVAKKHITAAGLADGRRVEAHRRPFLADLRTCEPALTECAEEIERDRSQQDLGIPEAERSLRNCVRCWRSCLSYGCRCSQSAMSHK